MRCLEKGIINLTMHNDLVKGCINGDRLAQKRLYELFHGRMMGVCLRYAKGREEAREILNKGFLKIFQALPKYQPEEGRLDSWIYKVIMNTAIDHFRAEVRHKSRQVAILETDHNAGQEDVIAMMSAEEIIEMIQQLTPAYRTVFNLYVMEGMSHKEIGEQLGISEGTSKSNLSKARRNLQEMINKIKKNQIESHAG